eukprot:gb/GEZN01001912.1/.p1 GENE.gb/GEZN01001912.1/~~gb/GEZN01001912.1/.p1  ORF type:complete len:397 (+),score=36.78 gb/GEZN01001912.1/:758-1948(+)
MMMTHSGDPLFMANIGLVGPILEEIVFRGILWRELFLCSGPILAYLSTAILFGSAHMSDGGDREWISGLAGAAFACTYHYTGTLLSPMIVHACINSLQIWCVSLASPGNRQENSDESARQHRRLRLVRWWSYNQLLEDTVCSSIWWLLYRAGCPVMDKKFLTDPNCPSPYLLDASHQLFNKLIAIDGVLKTSQPSGALDISKDARNIGKDDLDIGKDELPGPAAQQEGGLRLSPLSLAYLNMNTQNSSTLETAVCLILADAATVSLDVSAGSLSQLAHPLLQQQSHQQQQLEKEGLEDEGIFVHQWDTEKQQRCCTYYVDGYLKRAWRVQDLTVSETTFKRLWRTHVRPYIIDFTETQAQVLWPQGVSEKEFLHLVTQTARISPKNLKELLKEYDI